jgi:predicted O-methyltransferase YrrM
MLGKLAKKSLKVIKNEGLLPFLKKATNYVWQRIFHYIVGPSLTPYFIYKLKRETSKVSKLEDLVELAFNFKIDGLNIAPLQIKEEILKLLEILEKIKPKTILEIGTAAGGTLFLFSQIASSNAIIISIDLPGGKFGGGYLIWKIPIYQAFKKENQKFYLLRKDSHKEDTLEEFKKILNGKELDFLFIDGDHSYEGVKKDFEMYSSLVRKGGIIAFHDIVKHPPETGCEVEKLWEEIKNNFNFKELIKDVNQNWAGIGVLIKS